MNSDEPTNPVILELVRENLALEEKVKSLDSLVVKLQQK